jgi:hypothetical protein
MANWTKLDSPLESFNARLRKGGQWETNLVGENVANVLASSPWPSLYWGGARQAETTRILEAATITSGLMSRLLVTRMVGAYATVVPLYFLLTQQMRDRAP